MASSLALHASFKISTVSIIVVMKTKNQPGGGCAGSLMAEMKHNLLYGRLGC